MLNRDTILGALREHVAQTADADGALALMVVRMHDLRSITLRFGYDRGDQAEAAALALIQRSLRPIDRCFRNGEGSFLVALPGVRNGNHALLAATRLVRAFETPLAGAETHWHGPVVMGVAVSTQPDMALELLCRQAELAHDEAQRRGERFALYEASGTQVEIFYGELREAIESNRLHVHFQPVWDLQRQRVAGVESLARWTSPRHGEVSPANFIPFAEQSDLISTLTRWSVNATLRHASAIDRAHPLSFAINFSPRVFGESGVVEQLLGALNIWGVAPTAVVAEITETALVNDLELSVRVMRRMRDHGIRIAIDDFGTGYASFAYLRKFPATELKIDKSLVAGICDDSRSAKLVRAMVDMAHHLDLVAIAEGIEDQATSDLLAQMGCDFGQGYHLGRPEPAADFVARFAQLKVSG